MEITNQNRWTVKHCIDDLNYLLSGFESVKDEQDYLDINALEIAKDRMQKDLDEFDIKEKLGLYKYIKEGDIVKITSSNGIDGWTTRYLCLREVNDKELSVILDTLTVETGEFDSRISYSSQESESISRIVGMFESKKVETGDKVKKEFEDYLKLLNTLNDIQKSI